VRDLPFRDPQTGKVTRPVQLLDASEEGELFPPADHPGAITVGDGTRFSSAGPTADGRSKPDVILEDSTAQLSNGEETTGSSNAAAYFAGVVAVMKATQPGLQTRHVLALARRGERPGSSTQTLRPEPARPLLATSTPFPLDPEQRPTSRPSPTRPVLSRAPPSRPPWRTPSPEKLAEVMRSIP